MKRALKDISNELKKHGYKFIEEDNFISIGGIVNFMEAENSILFIACDKDLHIPLKKLAKSSEVINKYNSSELYFLKIIINIYPDTKEKGYVTCSFAYEMPCEVKNTGTIGVCLIDEYINHIKQFYSDLGEIIC